MARSKHHHNTRRPRETTVYFDLGTPKPVNGATINPRTGKVALTYNGVRVVPAKVGTRVGYQRNKGMKSTVQVDVDPRYLCVSPNFALEQYGSIFAVDTNTRQYGNDKISVTSIVHGKPSSLKIPEKTAISIFERQALEFRNTSFEPEKVGWHEVIVGLQKCPGYHDGMQIALIVDSDLDNLAAFNARVKPILNNHYLPPNFTLLYASADTQGDSIANKMIAMADKDAKEVLTKVIGENAFEESFKKDSELYTYLRPWLREKM
ncbi:MAG: hypothetical protein WAO19_03720 [Candidatus Kryptoniota bacterium]